AADTERELSLGLQRTMMPSLGPDIPGMTVAARYVPTGGGLQIGGDWYDLIPLPSGRIALVIGDVQGHDVRAAGLMGQLRIALRAEADADYPTTRVVLEAGETIMLCTDGLIETGGHDLATGWVRLRPILERHTGDLEKLADALVQAVHGPGSHYTTGALSDRRE